MKVLTDTHSLVWALSNPKILSKAARTVLVEANVSASVANLWELCLKANRKEALLLDPASGPAKDLVARAQSALGGNQSHQSAQVVAGSVR